MQYRKMGRTGLKVSALCLGTMQFGWTADEEASVAVMDAFIEGGGNFIDTADIYTNWAGDASYGGRSEEIIGEWLESKKNRKDIILATKVRGRMSDGPNGEGLSRSRIIQCCDDSLRRLRTDYIDLYQCHWADLNTPIEETLSALDDLVRAGKVRYIGASNYPAWRLMEAVAVSEKRGFARFETYQPEYSVLERQLFEYEAKPFCTHYGLGVIPYSPLAGGFLTGKYRKDAPKPESARADGALSRYGNDRGWNLLSGLDEIALAHKANVAQISLAWLLAQSVMTAPIIGANTPEQLADLLPATEIALTTDEINRLNDLTKWVRNGRPIWD